MVHVHVGHVCIQLFDDISEECFKLWVLHSGKPLDLHQMDKVPTEVAFMLKIEVVAIAWGCDLQLDKYSLACRRNGRRSL